MRLPILISIILLASCSSRTYEKFAIDRSSLDSIVIRKRVDTVSLRLSNEQVDSLISRLENSKPLSPRYVMTKYFITMHYNDGHSNQYQASYNIMRGNGGRTYDINDKEFVERLWMMQAGLTKNHYEYFPTYLEDGKYVQYNETLSSENLEKTKKVLDEAGHKCTEIRGVLFYEGYLSEEQLAAYTAKARN